MCPAPRGRSLGPRKPPAPHLHRAVVSEVNVYQVPRSHLDVFDEVNESAASVDDMVGIDEVVARRMRSAILGDAHRAEFQ